MLEILCLSTGHQRSPLTWCWLLRAAATSVAFSISVWFVSHAPLMSVSQVAETLCHILYPRFQSWCIVLKLTLNIGTMSNVCVMCCFRLFIIAIRINVFRTPQTNFSNCLSKWTYTSLQNHIVVTFWGKSL